MAVVEVWLERSSQMIWVGALQCQSSVSVDRILAAASRVMTPAAAESQASWVPASPFDLETMRQIGEAAKRSTATDWRSHHRIRHPLSSRAVWPDYGFRIHNPQKLHSAGRGSADTPL
jgi:hypothetical protein